MFDERRRDVIKLVGGAVVGWPVFARAQQAAMPVIGFLRAGEPPKTFVEAFQQGLQERGYVDGQNVVVKLLFTDGSVDELPHLAEELVRSNVDVILASAALQLEGTEVAARTLGMQLEPVPVRGPNDFDAAFKAVRVADGLLLLDSSLFTTHRARLVGLAAASRLPAIYGYREMVEAGGLISYGANIPDTYRRAATYVAKILKGAKPADLPVEQPTTL